MITGRRPSLRTIKAIERERLERILAYLDGDESALDQEG